MVALNHFTLPVGILSCFDRILSQGAYSTPRKEKGGRNRHNIMSNWSDEETDEPLIADHRNFYKVEK